MVLSLFEQGAWPEDQQLPEAFARLVETAQLVEALGYHRIWLAEHHGNKSFHLSGTHVVAAHLLAHTSTLRVGTASTIIANFAPIQIADDAGALAALSAGRFDLGIGRARLNRGSALHSVAAAPEAALQDRVVDGLRIPALPARSDGNAIHYLDVQDRLFGSVEPQVRFDDLVHELLALLRGPIDWAPHDVRATVDEAAPPGLWFFGTTPGGTARIAGELGRPFFGGYHHGGTFLLESIDDYRDAFTPSEELAAPYVGVTADVLIVSDNDPDRPLETVAHARWRDRSFATVGGQRFPSIQTARLWLEEERAGAAPPRSGSVPASTRIVGSADEVRAELATLQRVTGADEIAVSVHALHPDRRRSTITTLSTFGL